MKSKFIFIILVLGLFIRCINKSNIDLPNSNYTLCSEFDNKISVENYFDGFSILSKSIWYSRDKKPFLKVDYTKNNNGIVENFDKTNFDNSILDTPTLRHFFKNDSIFIIDIICKGYPMNFLTGIGWNNIREIEALQINPISNSYKFIGNKNRLIKDSILYFNFDFFNPNNDKIIKKIERINVNL